VTDGDDVPASGGPDRSEVQTIARAVLAEPDALLLEARVAPLAYDVYLPGRSLERVVGRARVRGEELEWSVIRKRTGSAAEAPPALIERARREARVYGSGLLDDLGALRAPRAHRIEVAEDGAVVMWLEDVRDDAPGPWSPVTFARAAEALGEANGRQLGRPLAAFPWLVQDWADRQSEPVDEPTVVAAIAARAREPRVRGAMGSDVGERTTRMVHDQPAFIAALGRLPRTLCHHDAARSNLIARSDAIVALDWESAGPGPLGADTATLVSGSVRKGDAPADDLEALDDAVFAGYVEGLRASRWSGDERAVRLGHVMSLALRCWFVRDTLRELADPTAAPTLGRALHVPPEEVLARFAAISRFLLDRTDEARRLASVLGVPLR
jgi:hypothetical protein